MPALVETIAMMGYNCVRMSFSLDFWFKNPVVDEHAVSANPPLRGLRAARAAAALAVVTCAAAALGCRRS